MQTWRFRKQAGADALLTCEAHVAEPGRARRVRGLAREGEEEPRERPARCRVLQERSRRRFLTLTQPTPVRLQPLVC
jgi:hypothetical protein